jgi:uncharacterized protein (TIGR02246 family)
MRHVLIVFVGVILFATGAALQTRLGTAADEAAVRAIWHAHDEAYNKHDAGAVAALYAMDGDQVNGSGAYFSGREPIEKNYANNFSGAGRTATVHDESSAVRFLTTDVAILDADTVYTGRSDGLLKGHVTSIYVRRKGAWTLVATRNTRKQ